MLDLVSVFSKSGVVLWSQEWAAIKGDPVNAVINGVLLEDRTGKDLYQDANYSVKWCVDNEMDIVVVMDGPETVNPASDTSFALMVAARERGHSVWHCGAADVELADGTVWARTRPAVADEGRRPAVGVGTVFPLVAEEVVRQLTRRVRLRRVRANSGSHCDEHSLGTADHGTRLITAQLGPAHRHVRRLQVFKVTAHRGHGIGRDREPPDGRQIIGGGVGDACTVWIRGELARTAAASSSTSASSQHASEVAEKLRALDACWDDVVRSYVAEGLGDEG